MTVTRREFLGYGAALGAGAWLAGRTAQAAAAGPARVAITLDLEMSRNFPRWEDTHWDYEKGNLNEESKRYATEAARRVAARGGRIHFFSVGRVCEQENVDWLKDLAAAGHPIGNHTYDHVYLLANKPEEIQFRFQRAPWLIEGQSIAEVIGENIRLCTTALKERAGIDVTGFRTPGGFQNGLADRPDVQELLLAQGFRWVSSKYPAHPNSQPGMPPDESVLQGIVEAQAAAQPFVYPSGLVEIPMSPISDLGAFRNGRWPLEALLEAVRRGLTWCIEHGAVYDFLGHPSCLYVADPEFRVVDLICELVEQAGGRACLATLDQIAQHVKA